MERGVFFSLGKGRALEMECREGDNHFGDFTVSFYSWFAKGRDCGGEGTWMEDLRSVSSFDKKNPRLTPISLP